ncbi:MAG: hypothetical protein QN183_10750 [Armatimonadota bacterium]|nr:hypothetical protein [Armatimonadota bacterium]MDR7485451.1 hypothetical protein [Armatimonadota bacterium]MDR7534366.1 hypothetical protein [Armatimonadota bacterium]MDR7536831.1 hypothetical protein [Armatimonadota bacterium]
MRRRVLALVLGALLVATTTSVVQAQAPVKLTFWSWRTEDK